MVIKKIYILLQHQTKTNKTMNTIKTKIIESFKFEFNMNVDTIIINERNSLVMANGQWYWCILNKNGVKKNSWRLEC